MKVEKIWMNGKFVDDKDATVSVLAHGLHYGSAFFEGIRAYKTTDGRVAIFRLHEHMKRLIETAKMYKTEIPFTLEELKQAVVATVKKNNLVNGCYIRPLVYRGRAALGVEPRSCPVEVVVAAWEWGAYLGEEALENGISCQVSSWRRLAPDTMPALAKAAGNYLSSQLIKMEAIDNGYDEGIALDYHGNVSEGSGENLFAVKDGVIYTPPMASSSLFGITRNSIMTLAVELGYTIKEEAMPREFLYSADEVFLTGTAAEVTPVGSIDRIQIGSGKRGPIAKTLQDAFFNAATGEDTSKADWLYYV